ncbi:Na(+)/H(+) antiporter NhaA [Methyloglobulus morosus KoM1]|uniref:Na(+)/H(+) antiporter NhaA n=1 Tax=Methyloglobulus morosus KoM1 TaxID=1116472 RepID=V5BZJ5_9GAMM|nr:signal peptide peptidase SppA [Methyloglobulus morosus]ESS69968.1 Na(+)/H(+) antiporter NhaA [Methyloglobulus morosus KoM1]
MENQSENPINSNMNDKTGWEREIVEKLAFAAITEQRRARRWGIFFKLLMFGYLLAVLGIAMYPKFKQEIGGSGKNHTAVINLVGMIAEDQNANAESIIDSLRDAVKDKNTKGIIIHANSPGGSPVQSAYVYDEIKKIKKEHPDLPIHAVVSDICASGCYYIVSAVDKIFASPASLIGSIGVIMDSFGFVDTMQKLGVERRLLTAGEHKALLDPFSPGKPDEQQYMQNLINQVHKQFIDAVRKGRGSRLKETPDMFSGLVWTGEESVKLGVVDAMGSQDSVAKDVIGAETLVDFTQQERLVDRIAGKLGASLGLGISDLAKSWILR